MNDPSFRKSSELFRDLVSRWRTMRAPLWHLSSAGVVQSFELPPEWQSLTNDPMFVSELHQGFAGHLRGSKVSQTYLTSGAILVQVESPLGHERGGRFAAVFVSNGASDLLTIDSQRFIEKTVRLEAGSIDGIIALFKSSISDLSRMINDTETTGQYANRLAQAYEEANLLFNLARSLNFTNDPRVVLQGICTQIQELLPFRWMSMVFDRVEPTEQSLRGKLILAGDGPSAELATVGADLLRDCQAGHAWTAILNLGKDARAAALGTELIAEPIVHDGQAVGMLIAGGKAGEDPAVSSFEVQILEAAAQFLGVFHQNVTRFAEQERMFLGTLNALTASIDAKDPYTRGHSERVGLLAGQMARALDMSSTEVERYRIAGIIHDVGKIGVPEAVLCKRGRLTAEEFDQIKRHPQIGYDILKGIPGMQDVLPGVLHHHEKWNGKGYPYMLAGEQIPLIGRVLAVCDTFDAMSSNRSYRAALPREQILKEIGSCAGSQFDPALAAVFATLDFDRFGAMFAANGETTPTATQAA